MSNCSNSGVWTLVKFSGSLTDVARVATLVTQPVGPRFPTSVVAESGLAQAQRRGCYPRCQSASFVLNVSSLCALLAGSEECAQGGSELSGVEGAELPRAQALAVPGAKHPAHDGPGRAAHTEGRLAGERGRGHQGRRPGQWRGQQLSSIRRTEWTSNKSTHTWDSFNHPFFC